MSVSEMTDSQSSLEEKIHQIGEGLWKVLSRRRPSVFERRWLEERLMNWAMADESIKVQMFRFVDVLPMLHGHESINRHLHEYFEEVKARLPWAARLGLELTDGNGILSKALAYNARVNASRMAERFIAGSTLQGVEKSLVKLRDRGMAFTIDQLGEAVLTEEEAEAYQQRCLDLLDHLCREFDQFVEAPQIDQDETGSIPRVNLSLKLSALDPGFSPIDAEGSSRRIKERLRPIFRKAIELGAFLNFDMEQNSHKPLTISIFKELLEEEEFREFSDIGIVIQAYQPAAQEDLADLLSWVVRRGAPVWIRLVKGAYWDYETTISAQHGWPCPVYQHKWESDVNFERLSEYLLDHREWLKPAFGSHNLRSLTHAFAYAQSRGIPQSGYEVQMLYGMGQDMAQVLMEQGYRVRIYTPYGALIPGMAYLVRRLLENTSNDSFLQQSVQSNVSIKDLLKSPANVASKAKAPNNEIPISRVPSFHQASLSTTTASGSKNAMDQEFQNEPLTDFSLPQNREKMSEALKKVKGEFGKDYALIIDGKSYETKNQWTSRCPFQTDLVLGRVSLGNSDHVTDAIEVARRTFSGWSNMEPKYRAEYLDLIGSGLQKRRFELAAWIVYEVGKPWQEADGDVAEAIDFCRYYATQMRQIADEYAHNLPGEENSLLFRAKGVAVVIAPWNFPLAILTGMTVAALVTGNTVIMKPAEQSSIVAAKLMEIINTVGLPEGVVNYLPGMGEDVGQELVASPDVDLIAFTGSQNVGLEIYRTAADTDRRQKSVKKVIAEMGGKNSIIIDDDADLDEAVVGVLNSSFNFAGQKCSACSRVIVLEGIYDQFVTRLKGAAEVMKIGPADDPGTQVGPVIDQASMQRLEEAISGIPETYGVLVRRDISEFKDRGYFVSPTIFTDVQSHDLLAQDELFGPVLVVIKVKSFDEALRVANDTRYALTGAVFSRSPANLQKARREFQVGNLYLNRGCTGALVDRQPFGGFKMSGIGSKAGGPDYLWQFMTAVTITENTLRRGFAPVAD